MKIRALISFTRDLGLPLALMATQNLRGTEFFGVRQLHPKIGITRRNSPLPARPFGNKRKEKTKDRESGAWHVFEREIQKISVKRPRAAAIFRKTLGCGQRAINAAMKIPIPSASVELDAKKLGFRKVFRERLRVRPVPATDVHTRGACAALFDPCRPQNHSVKPGLAFGEFTIGKARPQLPSSPVAITQSEARPIEHLLGQRKRIHRFSSRRNTNGISSSRRSLSGSGENDQLSTAASAA